MKLRNVLGILGCAAALVTPAIVTGCSQAKVTCLVGHAGAYPYVLKFSNANIISPGDPKKPDECAALPGMLIGVETYHGYAGNNTRDLSVNRVAIGTDDLPATQTNAQCYTADDPAPDGSGYKGGPYADITHQVYAIGDFVAGEPGGDDFCPVASMSVAEQNIPEIPATTGMNPAPTCAGLDQMGAALICTVAQVDCCDEDKMNPGAPDPLKCYGQKQLANDTKYEWTNTKFYVTTDAAGTQMASHLKFTHTAPDKMGTMQTCEIEYDVIGLWPAVGCALLDDMGNPVGPDDNLCLPDADVSQGRPVGSGINPDFPTHCDKDLLYCVLDDGPLPRIRSAQ